MKTSGFLILPILAALSLTACGDNLGKAVIPIKESAPEQLSAPVKKSAEEWKKQLTPEQFYVLRKAGTEPSHSPLYKAFTKHGDGVYYCAGCGAELFSSKEKFDSGTGWPSFYDPSNSKNVSTDTDYKLGYARTEIKCAICDGHLGHLFTGEKYGNPTDKRYCINGTALTFVKGEKGTNAKASEAAKKN